jgi:hypothetical protein
MRKQSTAMANRMTARRAHAESVTGKNVPRAKDVDAEMAASAEEKDTANARPADSEE